MVAGHIARQTSETERLTFQHTFVSYISTFLKLLPALIVLAILASVL